MENVSVHSIVEPFGKYTDPLDLKDLGVSLDVFYHWSWDELPLPNDLSQQIRSALPRGFGKELR